MNSKPSKLLALGLAIAAFATLGHAQTEVVPTTSPAATNDQPGILGQSYTDLNFSWEDVHRNSASGYNAGLSGNIPVAHGVDVGLGYDYFWMRGNASAHSHLLNVDTNFFSANFNGVKPFVGGTVGYQWAQSHYTGELFHPFTASNDRWIWGATAGAEISAGSLVFTPRIGYTDTMDANTIGSYHYGLEAHHWFNETIGAYGDATYNDVRHNADSWTYTAGMRFRF